MEVNLLAGQGVTLNPGKVLSEAREKDRSVTAWVSPVRLGRFSCERSVFPPSDGVGLATCGVLGPEE